MPASITRRAGHTSGRLASAAPSVPAMKPSWTATVRPALPASPSDHSRRSAGRTAEAENQSESASSSASERTASCRQRSGNGRLLDDLALAQPRDVARAEAEILQDRLGVLAAQRRRRADRARRVGELDGDPELAHAPVGWMLDVHDHLAMVDLRVLHHLLDVVHLAHADVVLDQEVVPLVAVARLDDGLDRLAGGGLLGVGRAHELVGL